MVKPAGSNDPSSVSGSGSGASPIIPPVLKDVGSEERALQTKTGQGDKIEQVRQGWFGNVTAYTYNVVSKVSAGIGSTAWSIGSQATSAAANYVYQGALGAANFYIRSAHALLTIDKDKQIQLHKDSMRSSLDGDNQYVELYEGLQFFVNNKIKGLIPDFFQGVFADIVGNEQIILDLIEMNLAKGFATLAEQINKNRGSIPNFDQQPMWLNAISYILGRSGSSFNAKNLLKIEQEYQENYHQLDLKRNELFSKYIYNNLKENNFQYHVSLNEDSNFLLKLSNENYENIKDNLKEYLNTTDESVKIECINKLFFSNNLTTSFEEFSDANEAFKIYLRKFSDVIPLFNPAKSEELIKQYVCEKDEEKRLRILSTLCPNDLNENMRYNHVLKDFTSASNEFREFFSGLKLLQNYLPEIEDLIGSAADLFVESLFPNKIADLNLLGISSIEVLPELLYSFLRKFAKNSIRTLYLDSKENFINKLELVEFVQKQLPSILDIDQQRGFLLRKTKSTFSVELVQALTRDITDLVFNQQNKTSFVHQMLLKLKGSKVITHIDVRLMEQVLSTQARRKGRSSLTESVIVKIIHKQLIPLTPDQEKALENEIQLILERNRNLGLEEKLMNDDLNKIIGVIFDLTSMEKDQKKFDQLKKTLDERLEDFIVNAGNSALEPDDILQAYLLIFGQDANQENLYQLNSREQKEFKDLIDKMNAASFSENQIIGSPDAFLASFSKKDKRKNIIQKMLKISRSEERTLTEEQVIGQVESNVELLAFAKGRLRLGVLNPLFNNVKIDGQSILCNKEQESQIQKLIDSLIQTKDQGTQLPYILHELNENDLKIIFAKAVDLAQIKYTKESYVEAENFYIKYHQELLRQVNLYNLLVEIGSAELKPKDILTIFVRITNSENMSVEVEEELYDVVLNNISQSKGNFDFISQQIEGIFRGLDSSYAKNRKFASRLIEGLLLKTFTTLVTAHLSSSDKDIWGTLTEKVKPILADSYRELSHGQDSLVIAKKMTEDLFIVLGLSETVVDNGKKKLVPTKNFDWMPQQLHDLLIDKLPKLLEDHYLSHLKTLLNATNDTNPSVAEAKKGLKKMDQELDKLASESLEKVNKARGYVGKKPIAPKKANRPELEDGEISKTELVLLDLMQKAMPILDDIVAEKPSNNASSVFNTIGFAINEEFKKLAEKGYESADILLKHGSGEVAKDILYHISVDLVTKAKEESNQTLMFQKGINLLVEPLNDLVNEFRTFASVNNGESLQRVIGGIIRSAASHVKIIQGAKEAARSRGSSKITFEDILRVGGDSISPALPKTSLSFNKTIDAIVAEYPELNDGAKPALLKNIFKDLLAQEKKTGEKITRKMIFDILMGEQFLNRSFLPNEKEGLKKLSLEKLLREDAAEHSKLRKEKALDPGAKALLKAFNVKDRLTMVKPEYRKEVWKLLKNNPPDVIPEIMEELLRPENVIKAVNGALSAILSTMKGEIVISKSQPKDPTLKTSSPNAKMLGDSAGELVDELMKSLELPWILKKTLVGSDQKMRSSIKAIIGEQLVQTFNENLIDKAIHSTLESMLDVETKEKFIESSPSNVKKTEKKTEEELKTEVAKKLQQDRKEIKAKSRELVTASLSFLVRTCYAQAQFYIDEIIRKISTVVVNEDFADFMLLFKRRLTEVFEFLIFTIIGQTIQFCLTPVTKLIRYAGEKYLKLDDNLQALIDIFVEIPEDQPQPQGYNYSIFHENLLYNAAQTGFEIYEEEKKLQQQVAKNPKLKSIL